MNFLYTVLLSVVVSSIYTYFTYNYLYNRAHKKGQDNKYFELMYSNNGNTIKELIGISNGMNHFISNDCTGHVQQDIILKGAVKCNIYKEITNFEIK